MWIGFTDDPKLRFDPDRAAQLDLVAASHATVVRTLVQWWTTAPERPADPTDPFDPAYRFDDLDELVRNAQNRGLEVEMAVWGTPSWANTGKAPQYAPDSRRTSRTSCRRSPSRYSGRYPGYPFVRFYGIWNESNLATFLRPQFDDAGMIVGPSVYARLAIAGLRGVKAGNAQALVAIGETSSNGRNKHVAGLTDTVAPGTFLELVAKAAPRLQFDAWAQHPYPVPGQPGTDAEGALAEHRSDLARRHSSQRSTAGFRKGIPSGSPSTETRRGRASRRESPRLSRPVVPPTGGRDRAQGPARADVHLVRVPRLDRQHLAERALPVRRHAEAGRGRVVVGCRAASTCATAA